MRRASTEAPPVHQIELSGLDGGNLLGFLAALGTLRVLTLVEQDAEIRMSWVEKARWSPVVYHSRIGTCDEVIAVLAARITPALATIPKEKSKKKHAGDLGEYIELALNNVNQAFRQDHLDKGLNDFRKQLECAAGESDRREEADFFAALGSDCFTENKDDKPATTELRAIGAGNNEGFLGFMRTVHLETRAEHLNKALFCNGTILTRRHSCDGTLTSTGRTLCAPQIPRKTENTIMFGVRTGSRSRRCRFPTAPDGRRLQTVGFEDRDREKEITWPIWTEPLDLKTVGSLLASKDIQKADRNAVNRRGVAQVFRARRFTEGKYRNFSPARALL